MEELNWLYDKSRTKGQVKLTNEREVEDFQAYNDLNVTPQGKEAY